MYIYARISAHTKVCHFVFGYACIMKRSLQYVCVCMCICVCVGKGVHRLI